MPIAIVDYAVISFSSDTVSNDGSVKIAGLVLCMAGLLHLSCILPKFHIVSSVLNK